MIFNIYSIFDCKSKLYSQPFFEKNDDTAKRAFHNCVNSDSHQFGKYPADYTLFNIGQFDDEDSRISSCSPLSLGNGLEFQTIKPTLDLKTIDQDSENAT